MNIAREHFKRSGRPKRAFDTRYDAWQYICTKHWQGLYTIYKCDFCNKWHLASK